MSHRNRNWLIAIIFVIILSAIIVARDDITIPNPFNGETLYTRNTEIRLGLDLRGGLQTLLEADVAADTPVSASELAITRQILENRANGLGVSEVVMQTAGDRRIVAEFPGISNPEEVVAALRETALLEFVDFGTSPVAVGSRVETDYKTSSSESSSSTPTPSVTATVDPNQPAPTADTSQPSETGTVYHTVMTGADLVEANVQADQFGKPAVGFTLNDQGARIFSDYTSTHTGQYLGIVLDKVVISAPVVNDPITDGVGIISGSFTAEEANQLAVQLSYGALPVPVKVVESRTVGATLGEESVRKSLIAGLIGLGVVLLFMGLFYRLPGIIADVALITYTLITLAIFKFGIPGLFPYVTLTLPGIAGFILSIGMAVDANVLIFERLKEELRGGRNLRQAIDLGWSRAWPSIRDSNTSTLITCAILYVFGNTFGASMVKGFSVTLALGVIVSLFTAIIVTRTFLHTLLDRVKTAEHPRWFGL